MWQESSGNRTAARAQTFDAQVSPGSGLHDADTAPIKERGLESVVALRSVVLEPPAPPPGPRRTVVLRPGGPQPQKKKGDLIACIIGILLLLGSVVLVQVMPDNDYVNPRYKLSFPAGGGEYPSFIADYTESTANTQEKIYDLPNDNIVSIAVQVGFYDNYSASKPDLFRVTLYDPDGNTVGDNQIANPPAIGKINGTAYEFEAIIGFARWNFIIAPTPQEEIVEGARRNETQQEALERLEPLTHIVTKGAWRLKIELLEAGDCPTPQDPEYDPAAEYACLYGQVDENDLLTPPSPQDTGNRFTIENFVWSYYATCVETMAVRDPKPLPSCK